MILVIGEALVDHVTAADGTVSEALGGAPYNTARAAARLGGGVEYVGCLSTDGAGEELVDQLTRDGVGLRFVARTDLPTTTARAVIGAGGGATYRFELNGTSAPALRAADLARLPGRPEIVFTGGLALVADPAAEAIAEYVEGLADETLVVVDLNCRPAAIGNEGTYRSVLQRVVSRADLVKASDEDLDVLHPGEDPSATADLLVQAGARVILTAGADGSTILGPAGALPVAAAPLPGPIVDTIGAGDTFDGALLEWLSRHAVTRHSLPSVDLVPGIREASRAAAFVVTRRGADPPTRADLQSAG